MPRRVVVFASVRENRLSPLYAAPPRSAAPLLANKDASDYGATSDHDDDPNYYLGVPKSELLNTPEEGLSEAEAAARLERFGPNKLREKETNIWWKLFLEFVQPMPMMIWMAIAIESLEAYLHDSMDGWIDVAVLVVLQLLNVLVGFLEELKAGDSIAALRESLKPEATVKRGNKVYNIDATTLVPGDIVCLGAGGAIPADCILREGKPIQVDQAALTGESLPVTMFPGSDAKMGSTVTRGEIEATVSATGSQTFFGKTADLVQGVDELGHFEKVLREIMILLVASGVLICAVVFFYLLTIGVDFWEVLAFNVVLLVASIPIALRVVCTTTLALGCHELAAEKAIVARLSSVEELAGMTILCSDKTGTLTLNKMMLQEDLPTFTPGVDRAEVLKMAALAAKWWEPPKDALDTLVLNAVNTAELDEYEQTDYLPFDPSVKRTESTVRLKSSGAGMKVSKGAPHVILEMCANKEKIRADVEGKVLELAHRGIRSLAVARTKGSENGQWEFLGILTFLDPPRPGHQAHDRLRERLRRVGEDDHRRPPRDRGGDLPRAGHGHERARAGEAPADEGGGPGVRHHARAGLRRALPRRRRLRAGVPRTQVPHRRVAPPAGVPDGHDRRRRERRARFEARGRRHRRSGRDQRRAGCGGHRADGARLVHHRHRHRDEPQDFPAHEELRDLPHRVHGAAAVLLLHVLHLLPPQRVQRGLALVLLHPGHRACDHHHPERRHDHLRGVR
jgi:hypothetical protein